jgi:sugar lactone lactonase YvrE
VPVPGQGAEDVLVAADGTVHTATEDGAVWALSPGEHRPRRIGRAPGRPLGLELLPDGRLLVCDAHAGLLAVDPADGSVETLVTEVEGRPLGVCNNAAVAADGTIFFSDSTEEFPLEQWRRDLVVDPHSGRLIRRDPDGALAVVLRGLRFANGVALAADESFVCVAESTGRSVVRLWLRGERAGERDLFLDDLPGYPDNIARGSDGLIWVTIGSPKVGLLEALLRMPAPVRRVVARVPQGLLPDPKRTLWVQAYDEGGRLVHDVDLDATDFHMATGVREHHGRVWIGSLVEPALAWHDLGGGAEGSAAGPRG